MQLVIVESPTKAKKLAKYLGNEYAIEASVGHIRDLPKSGLGIDVDKNFEPTYEVNPDKKSVVDKLTRLAKKADTIILATDPDREGEAIAWHLQHILTEADLKSKKVPKELFKRATFHEITKQAVLDAIAHPSQVNKDLVDAQQARRVVDRLVGYKLSPVLWKKIRRGLSAGRVQSVALRLIAEREREIEAFVPDEYWELDVVLDTQQPAKLSRTSGAIVAVEVKKSDTDDDSDTPNFKVTGNLSEYFEGNNVKSDLADSILVSRVIQAGKADFKPTNRDDVAPVVEDLTHTSTQYTIGSVEQKERKRVSLAPFTTSTLQQTAATRLGMTSKQTMRVAQQLYEEGLITYHRTDSVALSTQAVEMARSHIAQAYGDRYVPKQVRVFAAKSKNAQEAHESIRSTEIKDDPATILSESSRFTDQHVRLYDLIQRRFVASQMETAVYDQTTLLVTAQVGGDHKAKAAHDTYTLKTTGSVLRFDGWMKLFPAGGDTILPAVSEGKTLDYVDVNAAQKFTQPPARYNDASLVKELEKRGIGRPSTYASIISVIEDRGYVERDAKRFVATAIGLTVSDFLVDHFKTVMDYDFTAEMEDDLDSIARGEKEWQDILKSFWGPFIKTIEAVQDTAERAQIPVEKTGEKCPDCGEGEIVIRTGRFGKFKSCSRFPDCKFTQNIVETVEGVVCPLCQKGDVVAKKSRWGKPFFGCSRYPDCGWASWKKPEPGETMSQAEWEAQQAEREERKKKREAKYGAKKTSKTTAKKSTKKASAKKTTTKKSTAKKTAAKKTAKSTAKK